MLTADISNIWGNLSLSDLLESEQAVFEAHRRLDDPEDAEAGQHGWRALPRNLTALESTAAAIRSETPAVVIVGGDGAALGARAAVSLLGAPEAARLYWAGDHLSAPALRALLQTLDGVDFSLLLLSKSGRELELSVVARSLRWLLERKVGSEKARQRIFVSTDGLDGPLCDMAMMERWTNFEIPSEVPAAYGVLSPAGLLPMAVAGVDLRALLAGAAEAAERMEIRSFDNPAWLYAVSRHLLRGEGRQVELLLSGEPAMADFGRWWQELYTTGESGIFPATGDLHMAARMASAPHLFETLVRFAPAGETLPVESDWKDLDGLGMLDGQTVESVQGAALQAALESDVDGGIPVVLLECGPLNARTLGELFWFFELSRVLSAYLAGGSPYASPGLARYGAALQTALRALADG